MQTILDSSETIAELQQFKFLDERNKDFGINVSNRAKELARLLADPDRIRQCYIRVQSL